MQAPYLKEEIIQQRADNFRIKFSDDLIPVKMEEIIELKLQISIIPSPNLKYLQGIDMIMMSNFKSIYVDKNIYSDETQKNRLRFSYAHEIGHFVLHKNIYKKFGIKDWAKFYKIQKKESYQKNIKRIDKQADIFAGYLLIPEDRLKIEKDQILESLDTELSKIKSIPKVTLNQLLASQLSVIFGVSQMAMFIALEKLGNKK